MTGVAKAPPQTAATLILNLVMLLLRHTIPPLKVVPLLPIVMPLLPIVVPPLHLVVPPRSTPQWYLLVPKTALATTLAHAIALPKWANVVVADADADAAQAQTAPHPLTAVTAAPVLKPNRRVTIQLI